VPRRASFAQRRGSRTARRRRRQRSSGRRGSRGSRWGRRRRRRCSWATRAPERRREPQHPGRELVAAVADARGAGSLARRDVGLARRARGIPPRKKRKK